MSQGAHTPGPWRWWTSNSFRRLSSDATGKDGDVLCAVAQSDGHPDIEISGGPDGPNGRLIAAAPELLTAATFAVCALAHASEWHAEYGDAYDQLDAAIYKAIVGSGR